MAYAFRSSPIVQACACAALIVMSACGDDDAGSMDAAPMDSATADAAPDASAPDCFEDPQTHEEIINACTDSESIDKDPELPLLLPDGGLPPLP